MAVKNVVFDLGGVLIDFNMKRMLDDNIPEIYHKAVTEATFQSDEWLMMDSGELEAEDAVEKMCQKLPVEIHPNVKNMILNRVEQMPPLSEMTKIIDSLHINGYKLYALSNCADWFHDFFKNHLPSSEKFSGYVISADYKTLKPDEEIYKILFNKYNLVAEECFFIDDSPANIETALRLGMNAHCFADRDFQKLRSKMKDSAITL